VKETSFLLAPGVTAGAARMLLAARMTARNVEKSEDCMCLHVRYITLPIACMECEISQICTCTYLHLDRCAAIEVSTATWRSGGVLYFSMSIDEFHRANGKMVGW